MNKMDMNSWNRWDFASSEELISKYRETFDDCKTLIEIGSLHGKNANQLKEELDIDNVFVVEANPYSYDLIKERFDNFELFNYAMGDENGKIKFNAVISDNPGVSSVLDRPDGYYKNRVDIVEVEMIRGDKFMSMNNISEVDLCKIDVEGFTYEVLVGFGDDIKKIKFIESECETLQIWEGQKVFTEINEYLLSMGFRLISDVPNKNQVNCHWVNSYYE